MTTDAARLLARRLAEAYAAREGRTPTPADYAAYDPDAPRTPEARRASRERNAALRARRLPRPEGEGRREWTGHSE